MYKLLLCWRYLRTRYIALASIISVMLGVATMIVVNAVMSGFATEMQNRIHGILSDVVLESRDINGFADPQWHMDQIRKVAGDSIEAMTPTIVVPAMLQIGYGENWFSRQVTVIGIDENTQSQVSDFSQYLQHPANRQKMSFELRDGGYDVVDHQGSGDGIERPQLGGAGWERRRSMAENRKFNERFFHPGRNAAAETPGAASASTSANAQPQETPTARENPFGDRQPIEAKQFDPAKEQHTGAVLGIALTSYRTKEGEDKFVTLPGDDVVLWFANAAEPPNAPKVVSGRYTIIDLYESKMSEYDSSFVFVPLKQLQIDRGMADMVNSIQIRLKPGVDGNKIRDRLAKAFSPDLYIVQTWRDKQGALLSAVQMETAILNLLLFLIIAVSGFGILAIFFMIVVEKTRDIGILKSLGASGQGVMGIFLGYGLALGLVGSGVGMIAGLLIVKNINRIADWIGWIRGEKVFDPSIYYFYKIPAIVDPLTVTWIVCGALAIAVLASVLPAVRAAQLHPVEALRHE
jgi:lipoprotein-releasing system permease protein